MKHDPIIDEVRETRDKIAARLILKGKKKRVTSKRVSPRDKISIEIGSGKEVSKPSMQDFNNLISTIQKQARKAGVKKSDLAAAIKKVRAQK